MYASNDMGMVTASSLLWKSRGHRATLNNIRSEKICAGVCNTMLKECQFAVWRNDTQTCYLGDLSENAFGNTGSERVETVMLSPGERGYVS